MSFGDQRIACGAVALFFLASALLPRPAVSATPPPSAAQERQARIWCAPKTDRARVWREILASHREQALDARAKPGEVEFLKTQAGVAEKELMTADRVAAECFSAFHANVESEKATAAAEMARFEDQHQAKQQASRREG